MVPFLHRPINFSIITTHASVHCNSHRVEDCSSSALSNGVAPVFIPMLDSRTVDITNLHPAPLFPSFNDPSDPATTVPYRMDRLNLRILFLVGHPPPKFECSRLPSVQVPLVPYVISVGVAGLWRSRLTYSV